MKMWGLIGCGGMTVMYVGILHSPTLLFRRPPPTSYYNFLLRRFVCASISSLLSLFLSSLLLLFLLPLTDFNNNNWNFSYLFSAFGIRASHFCRAMITSFALTCLMYAGSFTLKFLLLFDLWGPNHPFSLRHLYANITSLASDITAWRNLVVAPITEELVFRACMIPLLLCGGFKPQTIVFLCPAFFSLAHLNHLLEVYSQKNCSILKTSMAVGTQLAYTMVFGSYASFLFIRTGHLVAPLVAHVVCNFMGLPVVYSERGLVVSLVSIAGAIGFLWLLNPLTVPTLYNFGEDDCRCWQGYCTLR